MRVCLVHRAGVMKSDMIQTPKRLKTQHAKFQGNLLFQAKNRCRVFSTSFFHVSLCASQRLCIRACGRTRAMVRACVHVYVCVCVCVLTCVRACASVCVRHSMCVCSV